MAGRERKTPGTRVKERRRAQTRLGRRKFSARPLPPNQPRAYRTGLGRVFRWWGSGLRGGLDAFIKFLKAMPADSGMAFIFIPDLDPSMRV